MEQPIVSGPSGSGRPTEHQSVIVVAGRVVNVETLHVGAAIWVARGRVSAPLPSGPFLESPLEITATGHTEEQAVSALRRRIERISEDHVG